MQKQAGVFHPTCTYDGKRSVLLIDLPALFQIEGTQHRKHGGHHDKPAADGAVDHKANNDAEDGVDRQQDGADPAVKPGERPDPAPPEWPRPAASSGSRKIIISSRVRPPQM